MRYDDNLPIAAKRDEIKKALAENQVLVIAGETGSGKTTQLPKLALAAGQGAAGMIGCTQPRRIAARSVARRVAEELQTPLGELVGYQVRFDDRIGPSTAIKVSWVPRCRILPRCMTMISSASRMVLRRCATMITVLPRINTDKA